MGHQYQKEEKDIGAHKPPVFHTFISSFIFILPLSQPFETHI